MPDNRGQGMNWIRLDLRLAIYARDHFDCVWCRQMFPIDPLGYGLTLDHINGPSNRPDNLVTACNECNVSRGSGGKFSSAAWARVHRALARPVNRDLGKAIAVERKGGFTLLISQNKGFYPLTRLKPKLRLDQGGTQ